MNNQPNRLNILSFTHLVISDLQNLEDSQVDLEEAESLKNIPSTYKDRYWNLITEFQKSSFALVDEILEKELLQADLVSNCPYSVVED